LSGGDTHQIKLCVAQAACRVKSELQRPSRIDGTGWIQQEERRRKNGLLNPFIELIAETDRVVQLEMLTILLIVSSTSFFMKIFSHIRVRLPSVLSMRSPKENSGRTAPRTLATSRCKILLLEGEIYTS
jgi:hypothetical protein